MSTTVHSYCRGCVSYCGLLFEVDQDRIIAVEGDRNSLVSEGYKCIKGDMSVQLLQGGEQRLARSQRRVGDTFEPIDNEALMDEVAAAIRQSIERHGPRSVALYFGTAGYRKSFNLGMAKQFMGLIDSPMIFSTMTIDGSAHWVVDGRMGVFATGRPFLDDTDVLVFSGTNPVVSHGGPYTMPAPLVNHTPKFRAFKARGGKIVVVDPRKTETARQATLHIQPRPGTDTEIFAGIIRIILERGWHDRDFCARYVTNLDALERAVAPFTPAFVAARAGIPEAQLLEAAEIIGTAKRMTAGFGTGTSMSPNPNTAAHMIEGLNAICGGFARAGDVAANPGVFARRSLVEMVIPPNRSWEAEPKLSSGYGTVYGEFPSSQLAAEILGGEIRTLIVVGANPAMTFGEPDRMREALQALDHLIVVEPRMTETAQLADYIVAPPIQYEVEDFNIMTAGWLEKPVVQYTRPVVPPPPGVIEEWKFFNGLANRLGYTMRLAAFGFGGGAGHGEALLLEPGREWTTSELIERAFADAGVPLDAVKASPSGWSPDGPPQVIAAPAEDDGARLDVCPPDVADELRQVHGGGHADGPGYRLISRRIIELMNTEFRFGEPVLRRFPGSPLYIHPEDMAQEGLAAGERVRIRGAWGEIEAFARPDPTLRRGVVAMTHAWSGVPGDDPLANHTSWLVSMQPEHVQKIDGMPLQSSLPVTIARAG